MSVAATPVLWHIEISHYNEKARWALDWKGVEHVRKAPQPGLHPLRARRLTGGATLPVLELDGRAIGDSTRIIAELEARFPDPPLYPAETTDRRRALEIEDFFDEQVAPDVRRLVFFHVLSSPGAAGSMAELSRAGPLKARGLRLALPLVRRDVKARYGVSAEGAETALTKIRAGLARIEDDLQPGGHLVGDGFSVADLTAAAILAPLARPREYPYPFPTVPPSVHEIRESLEGRALEWVRETYARHRPPSAEVGS
ncbi:MAG: glutathione S-transferase family protein [Thermoleophilaceae bacterium]